jgi:hypothetical protein
MVAMTCGKYIDKITCYAKKIHMRVTIIIFSATERCVAWNFKLNWNLMNMKVKYNCYKTWLVYNTIVHRHITHLAEVAHKNICSKRPTSSIHISLRVTA